MANVVQWIASTALLASLMVGLALILLLLAVWPAEILNERYQVDDDWSILAMPVGALLGLILGVRYRGHRWLRVLAGILSVLSIGLVVGLSFPIETTQEGMRGLPIVIGNEIRGALLGVVLILSAVSLTAAVITNSISSLTDSSGAKRSCRTRR